MRVVPFTLLFSLSATAVFLSVLPVSAQERRDVPEFRTYGEVDPEDALAIDGLVQDFKDAWSREDTDGLISLHAEDVEWINAYARMFQGAEPLADFLEYRLFPNFSAEVSRQEAANMQMVSIRYLPDAAVVHMYTDGERGEARNPGEEMRRTHIHLVLSELGSDWKIVHTVIMDAR